MAFYDKCEMVVGIFEKLQTKIRAAQYFLNKYLAKANRLEGMILDLKPEIPALKHLDFALYDEIVAACPFLAPFIPENPLNRLNAALADLTSLAQSKIDDAFNELTQGPLDKLAAAVDTLNELAAPIRAQMNALIDILGAITTCMDKLCDLTTAETYKKQYEDWKTWALGNEEEESAFRARLTSIQNQYVSKTNAWKEWASPPPKWGAAPVV